MVYFSDLLPNKFPELFLDLTSTFNLLNIKYDLIVGTKDIWCRDYMPVLVGNELIQFKYNPPYLKRFKSLKTSSDKLSLFSQSEIFNSCLTVDGGNVVTYGKKLIITDAIFDWNSCFSKRDVITLLKSALKMDEIIVIPSFPDDIFRHADGVVKFLDDKTVFVIDDSKYLGGYTSEVIQILKHNGIKSIPIPYVDYSILCGDSFTARGNYINVLETQRSIILINQ